MITKETYRSRVLEVGTTSIPDEGEVWMYGSTVVLRIVVRMEARGDTLEEHEIRPALVTADDERPLRVWEDKPWMLEALEQARKVLAEAVREYLLLERHDS